MVSRPRISDRIFLEQLRAGVRANLARPDFGVAALARSLGLSRRPLQRRVVRLTGLTPVEYLRTERLETARRLLQSERYATVAEVAEAVGYSRNYFYRLYRERYGHAASVNHF